MIYSRKKLIAYQLNKSYKIWPIDEKAKEKPSGWAGWPEKKKFSLVLTHDVETEKGLDKCIPVIDLERKLGFKSSFNFVAEDYVIPQEILDYLKKREFEIGIHGLNHHDNLFRSKKEFQIISKRINVHIKKWNVVGFRAPKMFHDFEMINELNIEYDSSTFDTDPFEPQPDGMGTIFPFWVQNGYKTRGYVELPYTLPQDFTLFVLMQQKNVDIWKKKLDWIAENGGMALLITHPDYMCFGKARPKIDEYPAEIYEEFLNYIKNKYDGIPGAFLHGPSARRSSKLTGSSPSLPKQTLLSITRKASCAACIFSTRRQPRRSLCVAREGRSSISSLTSDLTAPLTLIISRLN